MLSVRLREGTGIIILERIITFIILNNYGYIEIKANNTIH